MDIIHDVSKLRQCQIPFLPFSSTQTHSADFPTSGPASAGIPTFYSSELFEVNINLQEFTLSSVDHFDRKPLTRLLDDKLKV